MDNSGRECHGVTFNDHRAYLFNPIPLGSTTQHMGSDTALKPRFVRKTRREGEPEKYESLPFATIEITRSTSTQHGITLEHCKAAVTAQHAAQRGTTSALP